MPPSFQDLLRGFTKSPLPTMLALSILLSCALLGKISAQYEAKERLLRENTAMEKRCAEDRIRENRDHQIEKDSIYKMNMAIVNAALERMGKLNEKIKQLEKK